MTRKLAVARKSVMMATSTALFSTLVTQTVSQPHLAVSQPNLAVRRGNLAVSQRYLVSDISRSQRNIATSYIVPFHKISVSFKPSFKLLIYTFLRIFYFSCLFQRPETSLLRGAVTVHWRAECSTRLN